jgi:hypothetical protein
MTRNPVARRHLTAAIAAFAVGGAVLGATTLAVVVSLMNAFRAELREQIAGLNDAPRLASFEVAAAHEQQVMLAGLTLIVVVSVLCIGAGLLLLRREWAKS